MRAERDVTPKPLEAAKRLLPGCQHEGCAAPAQFVKGGWCISHNPDPAAKQRAVQRGGEAIVRKRMKATMPADSPNPDFSSTKSIRAWAEDRAGRIERGELEAHRV